nr:hypothetical protein [Pandoravirus aubagnensis]
MMGAFGAVRSRRQCRPYRKNKDKAMVTSFFAFFYVFNLSLAIAERERTTEKETGQKNRGAVRKKEGEKTHEHNFFFFSPHSPIAWLANRHFHWSRARVEENAMGLPGAVHDSRLAPCAHSHKRKKKRTTKLKLKTKTKKKESNQQETRSTRFFRF